MMMMCDDLMCTYKLTVSQLSLAHDAKVKTDMTEKNQKTARFYGVSPVGGKVEELWRKGFVEKISFEPGVEELGASYVTMVEVRPVPSAAENVTQRSSF